MVYKIFQTSTFTAFVNSALAFYFRGGGFTLKDLFCYNLKSNF